MKWLQNIIQLIRRKTPGQGCVLWLIAFSFLSAFTSKAQNKYSLIVSIVDQDTAFPLSSPPVKLQSLALQTSFSNSNLCLAYVNRLPATLAGKGYPAASVDSMYADSLSANISLFLGPKFSWIEVKTDSIEKKVLGQSGWNEKHLNGKEIDFNQLQSRQKKLLDYYANTGYPFAQINLDSIQLEENVMRAQLKVNKGILYYVDSIRVYGKVKIKNAFLQHYLGISKGSIYNYEKLQTLSRQLQILPYLQEQQPYDVTMLGTGATLNLYLMPKRSNQVNFLVGFLPGDNITGKPQLTGDIHLDLKNALGSGESILLNWQQLQRKSPRLNLGYSHPYVFNSPFGLDFGFDLLKRDSSYLQLNSQLGIQYTISANQAGKIFIQNQRAYLLQGGYDTNQLKISKTLPPNIDVSSNNLGLSYTWINTDYNLNPQKGNEFNVLASAGLKKIEKNNDIITLKDPLNADFDFNTLYDSLQLKTYQVKVMLSAAHYFATAKRSTLKVGVNAGIFQSQHIFRNELFQIGGYRLLRGFNEESIYATRYAVFTAEYRYLAGLNSYLFGFTDAGLTKTQYQVNNFSNTFISVGLGLTFETKFGLLNLSYALGKRNDVKFDITNASKIHFGYINYF